MTQARKYAFDTEFAADGKIISDGAAVRRLTKEDIDRECALAYERGKNDAVAEAERDVAKSMRTLADAATRALDHLEGERQSMREEAARIAAAAARKIAGVALEQFGADHAQVAIEAAMDALRHQPRLLVKLPPATSEALRPRLAQMTENHAYAGAILVRDDPNLKSGHVMIDWTDGLIALDPSDIAGRIDALVEAALAAPTATGANA